MRRRPRVRLEPLISGGGQERGLRSGTVPAPLTVGLGAACEVAEQELEVSDKCYFMGNVDMYGCSIQLVIEKNA